MRSVAWVVAALTALGAAGCADQFRSQTTRRLVSEQEPAHSGSARLTVASLPPDLEWMADALRLFESVETGTTVQLLNAAALADARGMPRPATAAMTPGDEAPLVGGDGRGAVEGADLQVVSLPLTPEQGRALATVPAETEAAVGPALLPRALREARQGGQTLALPVSARWLALAWNPARLNESAAPVPPHLEAWVDQLRALRRSQPAQPPVLVAWAEGEIAGSFALLLAAHGGRLLDETGQPAFAGAEGEAAVELMIRMLEERLVQPTALETDTRRLAASLTGPYGYWLCSSDALSAAPNSHERLAALRLSGLPVTRARYQYPDTVAASLVQFRGVAVSRDTARPAAAWRLARFLADPVVLRSAPAATTVLAAPPPSASALVRQSRALVADPGAAPWPEAPGLNEALGRFLHAALRRILTPREALERAALQFRQPGALPESSDEPEERNPGIAGYPPGSGSPGGTDGAAAGTGGVDGGPAPAPGPDTSSGGLPSAGSAAPPEAPGGYPGAGGAPYHSGSQGQEADPSLRAAPEAR